MPIRPWEPLPNAAVYYRLFWQEFIQELLRLGWPQVIGALLAILILVFQLRLGVIPPNLEAATFKSIWLPYLLLVLTLILFALVRTPVKIHNCLRDNLSTSQALLAETRSHLNEINTPKISIVEQDRREAVAKMLQSFTNEEKEVLRKLLHGRTPNNVMANWPISHMIVHSALLKGRNCGLINHTPPSIRDMDQRQWYEIESHYIDALRFCLFGE